RVRCMVRRSSDLTYLRDLPVEWAFTDVRETKEIRQACQGVDAICHCAALTRAIDQETFMRVNAQGTEALARAALEAAPNLQRFLFVSSQAAAGPSQGPNDLIDETREPRPLNWYAKSKYAAEQALLSMDGSLPLTIVRPAAVFGPRDRDFFTYFDLVSRGLELKLGREERRVNLIFVHDLVNLILLALENKDAVGQIYCGAGQPFTYAELSQAIARGLNKRTVRITLPVAVLRPIGLAAKVQERLTGRPALLNEQRILDMRQLYWLCTGEKARRELGFVPEYDLETAVQETAHWYQENGWL
ncbi:MAG TPA: NAD-dependent epimerase/dehydratase family protein, partial [Anaerolineae bacterium]|nr:NAD-dependent epimerase/dehydratase family protein [Anaerolineae bacterium]